jgi:hypothetical protein
MTQSARQGQAAEMPERKAVPTSSIRNRMALDGLYLPAGAPWVPALRAELLAFPRGRYNDQVDAFGLIGQLLDVMGNTAAIADPLNVFYPDACRG